MAAAATAHARRVAGCTAHLCRRALCPRCADARREQPAALLVLLAAGRRLLVVLLRLARKRAHAELPRAGDTPARSRGRSIARPGSVWRSGRRSIVEDCCCCSKVPREVLTPACCGAPTLHFRRERPKHGLVEAVPARYVPSGCHLNVGRFCLERGTRSCTAAPAKLPTGHRNLLGLEAAEPTHPDPDPIQTFQVSRETVLPPGAPSCGEHQPRQGKWTPGRLRNFRPASDLCFKLTKHHLKLIKSRGGSFQPVECSIPDTARRSLPPPSRGTRASAGKASGFSLCGFRICTCPRCCGTRRSIAEQSLLDVGWPCREPLWTVAGCYRVACVQSGNAGGLNVTDIDWPVFLIVGNSSSSLFWADVRCFAHDAGPGQGDPPGG